MRCSGTGFFKNLHVFGALLEVLCDFFVFCTFWSHFGTLLKVLWNFTDDFATIFQLSDDFRGFWWTWPSFAHVFEPLLMVLCHFGHANFVICHENQRFRAFFMGSGTGFFKNRTVFEVLLKALRNFGDDFATVFQLSDDFRGFWWTWSSFAHVFVPLLKVLCHFGHANFAIFHENQRFWAFFLGSGTGF